MTKCNDEFGTHFTSWIAKQSLPVEAAVVTVTGAVRGAASGGLMGTLIKAVASLCPLAKPSLQALSEGPLIEARDSAVLTGVFAGITCVLKRLRGKEDFRSSMVAAFGSRVMLSMASGMWGPDQAAYVVCSGVVYTLIHCAFLKVEEKFSKPRVEEDQRLYNETRGMLTSLGLEHYENNFKSGLLTDNTLPLLTDSALQVVKIPIGPRLLILNHIEREKEAKKEGRRE